MYAVVATVHVEQPERSRLLLDTDRVPLVKRAPGHVGAFWLEPIDHLGMSVMIFETKDHAEAAAAYPVPPMAGVDVLSVDVREVYAHTYGGRT